MPARDVLLASSQKSSLILRLIMDMQSLEEIHYNLTQALTIVIERQTEPSNCLKRSMAIWGLKKPKTLVITTNFLKKNV